MERKELLSLMEAGPIRIVMNDGRSFDVAHPREALVTDISAYVLYRDPDDGRLKAVVLPLVIMAAVHPVEAT